jgi:hypothetical protein
MKEKLAALAQTCIRDLITQSLNGRVMTFHLSHNLTIKMSGL